MASIVLLVMLLVVASWPIAGWMAARVTSARPAWPMCPRCAYDTGGVRRDEPCPECGLTFEQAWRCLPMRARTWRRWWVWLAPAYTVFVGVTSAMLVARLPLASGYVILLFALGAPIICFLEGLHIGRAYDYRDRRTFRAWWLGALSVSIASLVTLGLISGMAGGVEDILRPFLWPFILALIVLPGPASGVGAAIGATIIWNRWRRSTRKVLGGAAP